MINEWVLVDGEMIEHDIYKKSFTNGRGSLFYFFGHKHFKSGYEMQMTENFARYDKDKITCTVCGDSVTGIFHSLCCNCLDNCGYEFLTEYKRHGAILEKWIDQKFGRSLLIEYPNGKIQSMYSYIDKYEKEYHDYITKKYNYERFVSKIRNKITQAQNGTMNSIKCKNLIGCSYEEFKIHIESKFINGMSWDNYGSWHYDHIKPLAAFNFNNIDEIKQACHYTNVQPLWSHDNHSKSYLYEGERHYYNLLNHENITTTQKYLRGLNVDK